MSRSAGRLRAPEPDTAVFDDTDPSPSGIPSRDTTAGQVGPGATRASHDDVRATKRRYASGWLGRYIGLLIAGIAVGGALLLWFAVSARSPSVTQSAKSTAVFGAWHIFYDTQAPAGTIVIGAIGLGLIFAAGVAITERVVMDRSRRSTDAGVKLLAPKLVMAETRGVFGGPVTVTVLIPAHNEAASIGATLDSLSAQDRAPNRVIVVADDCTDATEAVARAHGAEVFVTVGNAHKKAGALNQAFRGLLDGLGDNDVVMCMDADTVLDAGFLAAGVQRFTSDRALMAIGGLFYGEAGHGILGQLQRNEYVRYSREIRRRRGRVFVLTGTASMFRARALRTVAASRGGLLPGVHGDVYDTAALTEDNELTLAIKSLGGLMASPDACRVVTELMPTWRNLWTQRLRWQRGALENLGAYGPAPTVLRYWAQQIGIGYSVIALSSFWLLIMVTGLATDRWVWFPFWLGVGSLFVVDRVVSAWSGGWKARLLAVLLIPELVYDMYLDVVYVKGIFDITFARNATWGHVENAPRPTTETSRAQQLETAEVTS
ncbi:MAG TPA: glycosyltransferase family 2 protein [Acidimicrobiia bacterium]|nr:glycosyltransferase family 2 protein [Acidimicrobiia bacterium]